MMMMIMMMMMIKALFIAEAKTPKSSSKLVVIRIFWSKLKQILTFRFSESFSVVTDSSVHLLKEPPFRVSCRLFSSKISAKKNNLDLKTGAMMTLKRRSILLVILSHVFWIKTLRNVRQSGSPQTIGAVLILVAGNFVVLYQTLFWIEVKVFSRV